MSTKIKGITVEIGGDTDPLNKAITEANTKAKGLQNELRGVNTLLKGDPTSTVLLTQKQKLLNESIVETRNKLEMLKNKQDEVQEAFDKEKITEEQYRDFQREIESTKIKLKGLENELKQFGSVGLQKAKAVGTEFVKTGDKISAIGQKTKTMSVVAGAAIAGVIKLASDFETGMAKVASIADTSVISLDAIGDQILKTSNETGKSTEDVLEATYQAISASVDTADAVDFVAKSANLAKSGFTDTTTAVDLLTTTINAYGLSADDASSISDKLIQTQNKGKTTVAQLAETMGRVIPTASSLNVDIDNLATGYAELTKKGINTANATTYMSSLFDELGKSSSTSAKVLKNETGKSFSELMKSGKSLGDIIEILSDSSKKTDTSFNDLFSKANARKAALSLMSTGSKDFNEQLKNMKNSSGNVEKALEELQTPATKAKKAINQLKNSGIELGQAAFASLSPLIDDVTEKIEDATKWFNNLDDSQKELIVTIAEIVAVATPIILLTGKIASGLGSLIINITSAIIAMKAKTVATTADTVATGAATVATSGFSLALNAIPILAIVTGIALVASALIKYNSKTDDSIVKSEKLSEKSQESIKAFKEQKKAIDDNRDAQLAEVNQVKKLSDELENLVDKNGKIKKGYKNRVDFIKSELNDALGTEMKINGDILKGYKKISNEITKLIEKKKAKIILEANEENYANAIKEQAEVTDTYTKAIENRKDAEVELAKIQPEIDAHQKAVDDALLAVENASGVVDLFQKGAELEEAIDANTKFLLENNKTIETVTTNMEKAEKAEADALKKYKQNFEAREEYEKNYEEFNAGHYKKVINSVASSEGKIKDITKASQQELKTAIVDYNKDIVDAQNSRKTASSQAEKDYWTEIIKSSKTKRKEYITQFKKTGGDASGALSWGLSSNDKEIEILGANTGKKHISGLASGILAGKSKVKKATEKTVNTANSEVDVKTSSKKVGNSVVDGVATGINEMPGGLVLSLNNLSNKIKTTLQKNLKINSPSKVLRDEVGISVPEGIAAGIDMGTSKVVTAVLSQAKTLKETYTTATGDFMGASISDADFTRAVEHTFSAQTQNVSVIDSLSALGNKLDTIANKKSDLYMDGDKLVGGTIDRTDRLLGQRSVLASRGLPVK